VLLLLVRSDQMLVGDKGCTGRDVERQFVEPDTRLYGSGYHHFFLRIVKVVTEDFPRD